MVEYSRTGRPVNEKARNDWDAYLYETRCCHNCGRVSLLLDVCPDCGTKLDRRHMRKNFIGNVCVYLAALLLVIALQVFISKMLVSQPLWVKIVCTILCVGIHCLGLLGLGVGLYGSRKDIRLWGVAEACGLLSEENVLEGIVKCCPTIRRVRDGYYLDIAYLEQAVQNAEAFDTDTLEKLLGQAVWLSMISDDLRLARVRFAALCKLHLYEGMTTDIDAILDQMEEMDERNWTALLGFGEVLDTVIERPKKKPVTHRGLQTLCDALCFDAIGVKKKNVEMIIPHILKHFQTAVNGDMQEEAVLKTQMLRVIAYYGLDIGDSTCGADADPRDSETLCRQMVHGLICQHEST